MATPVETIGRAFATPPARGRRQRPAGQGRRFPLVFAAGLLVSCADFGADPGPLLPDGGFNAGGSSGVVPPSGAGGAGVPPTTGTGGSAPVMGTGGSTPPPPAGDAGRPDAPPTTAMDTGTTPPPASGECPASASFGILLSIDVTWPGSTATTSGTGVVRLWNRADLTANGTMMTGTVTPCGTVLPETTLTALGRVAAGGNKILIEVPPTVWDTPGMPKFPVTGTRSSAALPGMIQFDLIAPLGFTPPDPKAAWPDSYTALKDIVKDIDGDGSPGYVSQPRGTDPYVLPPTSLGLGGLAPAAEKVFLINRNITVFSGTRTACDSFTGTANVQAFDSHVVGCVVKGGMACNDKQVDFVDQNRMKYAPKSATFKAQVVPANASCADIRGLLPQ